MGITTENQADVAIRPFALKFPKSDVYLRARLAAARFPEKEPVTDISQGVRLAAVEALVRYWGTEYDFGRVEARLKAFITEIDGLDIHFIHVRSPHKNALPLPMIHGWPGSVVEFLNVIGPLSDPTAHGGRAEDAFDVVVPSIPDYGFPGKPAAPGWGPDRIGRAFDELMRPLGYDHYAVQGGDWGAIIADIMGVQAPPSLLGIHSNMPGILTVEIQNLFGPVRADAPPSDLSAEEQRTYDQMSVVYTKGIGYGVEMALRPQTLYGIADSPAGLASWILDHDAQSYDDITRAFVDGSPVGNLTRDEVLDNITLTWLTNTGVSSARLYHESTYNFFDSKGVTVPIAVTVFPRELYQTARSWTERVYPNLMYFNEVDRGNHFAAWREPQLFSEEVARCSARFVR